MKKIINGIEYETLPEGKNAKELGFKVGDKFIVVYGVVLEGIKAGDIITFKKDNNTLNPYFDFKGITIPRFFHRLVPYKDEKNGRTKEPTQKTDQGIKIFPKNIITVNIS